MGHTISPGLPGAPWAHGVRPGTPKIHPGAPGAHGVRPGTPWGPGEDLFEKQKVWRERGSNEKMYFLHLACTDVWLTRQ